MKRLIIVAMVLLMSVASVPAYGWAHRSRPGLGLPGVYERSYRPRRVHPYSVRPYPYYGRHYRGWYSDRTAQRVDAWANLGLGVLDMLMADKHADRAWSVVEREQGYSDSHDQQLLEEIRRLKLEIEKLKLQSQNPAYR